MNIEKHPHHIFRIDVRPSSFIDDLNTVDILSSELLIRGKTKNLTRLKSFPQLEKLWIYSVNQNEFNTILDAINPKMVHFYEMKVEDLTPLEALKSIEVLALEWNTKAKTLWDLEKNTALKSLSIRDFSKLENISGLQNNTNLEILDLSGGIWNTLKLSTLWPLKNLHHLKYLGLSNIKVQDESLEPISYLKGLQELEISNQFPTEEYARLSVCLPNTNCISFQPYNHLNSPIDGKDVLVTGKRKPFLNLKNDVEKLRKYEERFRKLQENFREALKQ